MISFLSSIVASVATLLRLLPYRNTLNADQKQSLEFGMNTIAELYEQDVESAREEQGLEMINFEREKIVDIKYFARLIVERDQLKQNRKERIAYL